MAIEIGLLNKRVSSALCDGRDRVRLRQISLPQRSGRMQFQSKGKHNKRPSEEYANRSRLLRVFPLGIAAAWRGPSQPSWIDCKILFNIFLITGLFILVVLHHHHRGHRRRLLGASGHSAAMECARFRGNAHAHSPTGQGPIDPAAAAGGAGAAVRLECLSGSCFSDRN